MKKLSLLLSVFVLLSFTACDGPSLSGKTVKKTYFTGGGLQTEFIMDDKSGQNGVLKKYGFSGKLTSSVHIVNGVENGAETLYDKDGRVMRKLNYVNGRLEGIQSAYYTNGDVMVTYTYRNGVRNGVAQTYRRDGSVEKRVMYKNDRLSN
jgi:antitoxin component YwqK of YwqJK toxin-antitoxin module